MNERFTENPALEETYAHRFNETMQFVAKNFPNGFKRNARQHTTPRARFEAIAVGSYLALQQKPELANVEVDVSGWLDSKEFKTVTSSDGANVIKKLRGRLDFVRDHLLEA
jgi:hypothetical protein